MACKWCHNPETLSKKPQLLVYPAHCVGCGACVEVCAFGARRIVDGKLTYDRGKCTACGKCAENCFAGALVMSGREMSTEEVLEEAMQDSVYYKNSGGGITLSGGEITTQPEFAKDLLQAFKKECVHTALETNMYAPWEVYEDWMPDVDLIMFDIKMFDNTLHKKWTGVENKRILENAKRVAEYGKPYLVRTPVIPGVNDNEKEIGAIAEFIGSMGGAMYYELLRFNPLGESKYDALSASNVLAGTKPTDEAFTEKLRKAAEKAGIPVVVG